jgi:thiamine-phosphate pyrophosphorylase
LIYAITDRQLLAGAREPSLTPLLDFIEQIVDAGIDMIQIRERDLTARELYRLTQKIVDRTRGRRTLITVNDRADIAASTRAGVHLTTRSLSAEVVRREFGPDLLIGVSTHNKTEAEAAERGGADFVVFGPVFETASKARYGAPVGVESLREVTTHINIPVIALGGINPANFREALNAGSAGIAGISMFVDAYVGQRVRSLVSMIKNAEHG